MSEVCVRVAVRIRPLLPREVLHHHGVCVRVVPDSSTEVLVGPDRLFSFDHAFGPSSTQTEVYESCVGPLVEALVGGSNATVFCYGQTGSGKTFTLGGRNMDEEGGIIDCVARDVFMLLGEKKRSGDVEEATLSVSYMELYKEELRDLLEPNTVHKELHIREDERGNTVVVGVREMSVSSADELLSVVETGNALRHTATTGMNDHSSRSHAILALRLVLVSPSPDAASKSVRSAKLCLVDLAGSERAGKTGNTGVRLKESVHINTGLLALGNVIRALSDPARNRRGSNSGGAHVPFRAAKLTRLLRDSLGGTAHTLMVACVSPSDRSVTETLSVLQFASKARHIRNHPGVKTCLTTTWDPGEARVGELEHEVRTLRGLLEEKDREVERERTAGGGGEEVSSMRLDGEEPSQFRLLVQDAAALLADVPTSTLSPAFRQRLQDWQDRLTAVNHSGDEEDGPPHVTIATLREELNKCKEALAIDEHLIEQKDAELRRVRGELENLQQESRKRLKAWEEEKERARIRTEQLVDQQILINHLQSDLMTYRAAATGATIEAGDSGKSSRRAHSVPLIRDSVGLRPPRRIHSSPPAYSLERVMAAFKMRSHLLLAEIEDKDEVYRPFIKQQAQSREEEEEEEEEEDDVFVGGIGLRRSLNRTWTSRQKKSHCGPDQRTNGDPGVQQPQRDTGIEEDEAERSHMRKWRPRASVTQRRIQHLSVNMRMKEELIRELDRTDQEARAADGHGGDGGVLARLSVQRQQVRADVNRSLQSMKLQRAKLQNSLRMQTHSNNKEPKQHGEQREEDLTDHQEKHSQELKGKQCDSVWLEEEEERVFQKRAELQELEEELRRREEVLLHRETCLKQKNKLEIKKLRSSQALSQDLLRVSLRLQSVDEQLRSSSSSRPSVGLTLEELQRERDSLKKRKDALDGQLRDNRTLTVEEELSLLQLEEAIEALDAALDFKNRSIQDKQKKLLISDTLHQSQSAEPAQLCDVIRKLKGLSPCEASELLTKYFNKVVCLRETEQRLRLRCEELELHVGEQEEALREMEEAMQSLVLDGDRRLTQQHQDHQNHIQLLLHRLKEGGSGETQQATEDRLQHLEKELFFYKSCSRQLKKKLKEVVGDALHPVDRHTPEPRQKHNAQTNGPQTHTEEVQTRTQIATTHTKIHSEQTDNKTKKHAQRIPRPFSSSDPQAHKMTKMPENGPMHTQSQGRTERGPGGPGGLEMTPVRLCRRELRQISPADLQVCSVSSRRRQSVIGASAESILEDSIEAARNTHR